MIFAQGHALLIGVGKYSFAPRLDVPSTQQDAEALATMLADPDVCGYQAEHIQLLSAETATRDRVLDAFERLTTCTGTDDTIIIFYSGHGDYTADGQYCLTMSDTDFIPGGPDTATVITESELLNALRALTSRRVLLLLNACHAGAFSPTLNGVLPTGQSLPEFTGSAILATGEGRAIITACRSDQVAFVGHGSQTIFGTALLRAFHGAPARDCALNIFELYLQLYEEVQDLIEHEIPADLRRRFGNHQEPELTILKGVGPFAIALRKQPQKAQGRHLSIDDTAVRRVAAAESQLILQRLLERAQATPLAGGNVIIGFIGDGSSNNAIGQQIHSKCLSVNREGSEKAT
jgi:Caspase domain